MINKPGSKKVDISIETILKVIFVPTGLFFVWSNLDIVLSLFFAFILMSALRPFVIHLHEKRKFNRPIASILVFLLALSIFGVLLSTIVPPLISETVMFIEKLPHILRSLDPKVVGYFGFEGISQYVPSFANQAVSIVGNIFSNTLFVITTMFFSYYFLANENKIDENLAKSQVFHSLTKGKTAEWVEILHDSQTRLASWFWGQITLMTVVGLFSYLAFSIVGLRYAVPLAVLAGLLEVVPSIGPTIAVIPAFLIGFGQGPFMGALVLAISIVVQQVENNVFVPLIMKKAVGLNPVLTMIAVILGLRIAGPLGALLAIPSYVLFESIYKGMISRKL